MNEQLYQDNLQIEKPCRNDSSRRTPALSTQGLQYGVAIIAVIAAAAARLLFLQSLGTNFPFSLFYPAVMIAAFYGGLGPGLAATTLSAVLANYIWLMPSMRSHITHVEDWLRLAVFIVIGTMISCITEAMHRAKARAHRAEKQAEIAAERELVAEELRESKRRLAILAAATFEGIAITEGGKITYVNRQFARMFGYERSELVGVGGDGFLPAEDPDTITVTQGIGSRTEYSAVHKNGTVVTIEAQSRITTYCGRLVRITAARDITERKHKEEALARAKEAAEHRAEELAAVLASVPAAVWIAHGPACRYIIGNNDAKKIMGMINSGNSSASAPEGVQQILLRAMKSGYETPGAEMSGRSAGLHNIEQSFHLHDGTMLNLLGNATVLRDRGGKPRGSVAAFVDITARIQTEAELQKLNEILEQRVAERTEELREKDLILIQQNRFAAMGEMLNNIAHQWRQPLNALGLNVQQIRLFYDKGRLTEDIIYQSVDNAMALVQHMSTTIDDFRDFFKPEMEQVEFNVKNVVTDTLKLVEASFKNNQISIVADSIGDPNIIGYPNQYAQVVLNLLTNAKDAFDAQKNDDARVCVIVKQQDRKSIVLVRDNAGGIPDQYIHKVFDPHFTTKGPKGTGIGLFMAKNIIERNMHGSLSVTNTSEGAEFRIEV